jgi:hypothetical protein
LSTVIPPARACLYASTAGGLLVSAAAALGRLDSRATVGATLAGYVALVAIGLARPGLRMFTDALSRAPEGASLLVRCEVEPARLDALLSLFEARDARVTLVVDLERAIAHPEALRAALERGHGLVTLEREGPSPDRSRRARVDRALDALERERALATDALGDGSALDLWLPSGLYTPALQRVADALDRTLVAPTSDLRAHRAARGPATDLRDAVIDALGHGAIVLLEDTEALREALPPILDGATRLAVPVRPLLASQDP